MLSSTHCCIGGGERNVMQVSFHLTKLTGLHYTNWVGVNAHSTLHWLHSQMLIKRPPTRQVMSTQLEQDRSRQTIASIFQCHSKWVISCSVIGLV